MNASGKLEPERWLDQYGDMMFRFALIRLGDSDKAQDVVSETMIAAWKGRENYTGEASERNWLMGILKHKIIDVLRVRFRERPASEMLDHEAEETLDQFFDRFHHWRNKPQGWKDPRSALEESEMWGVLDQCVKALPEKWARVFELRIIQHYSVDEVSDILEWTRSNVGVLLHRARLRLRQCLEVNWFRPPKENTT